MKRLMLAAVCDCATAVAQQRPPDSSTTKAPEVFLDNHRPLIQKKGKAPTSRTVSGQVVDDSGTPLENALVTLTDDKTKEKRTFFTKKNGRYDFEDLSFTVDYKLQARWKTLVSDSRNLSQYDRAPKIVRILQVATPEGKPIPAATAKKEDPKQ
jgi:hypothetical protein